MDRRLSQNSRILITLGLVSAAYLLLQIALFHPSRGVSWDEAVYASQVSDAVDAFSFGAHRARGMPLLLAPVVALTDSIIVLRVYLATLSSGLLLWAFSSWVGRIGWGAPLGAAIVASSWSGLFYGSEGLPNLPVALIAVAGLGHLVRALESEARIHLIASGAAFGALVLLRPFDAGWILTGSFIGLAVTGNLSRIRVWGAIVIGSVVGAVPWIIEAFTRFGNPLNRLDLARQVVGGGWSIDLRGYAELLDGKLVGPDPSGGVNVWGVVWLAAVLGLVALTVSRRRERSSTAIALAAALLSILSYLVFVRVQAPRFLLPGLALLAVPAGCGAARAIQQRSRVGIAMIAAVALLIPWHAATADSLEDTQVGRRGAMQELGTMIGNASNGDRCFIAADRNYVQISYAARCRGLGFDVDDPRSLDRALLGAGSAETVWIVTTSELPLDSPLRDWPSASLVLDGHYVEWTVHWMCQESTPCDTAFSS